MAMAACVLLLLLALLGACEGKGTGGGIGRSGPRTSYGGGRVLSRGYTRRYFSPGLMLVATGSSGGSRYNCHSCTRTTAEDTMPAEMVSDVVVAEFDVQFPEGTDLGSDAEPSPLREAAEPFVEQRVAAVVAREVPSVTAADVTVADHWLADYDNRTLMFQVYVFSGGDDALAGRVHDALRLCGDCGASGAASATANQGTQCAAEGLAIVEDTRLADCCNTSVSDHVAAFAAAFGGLEGQEAPAGVRDSRIVDCGNRTLVPMRFLSEVEAFGPEEVSSAKAGYPVWMWFLTAPLGLGIWVLSGWLIGRNTYHRGGIGSSPTYCGCLRSKVRPPPSLFLTPFPTPCPC